MANLQSKGTIRRFTLERKRNAFSIILIKTTSGASVPQVANQLAKLSGTVVYEVAGKMDIVCLLTTNGLEETNKKVDEIQKVEGVKSTETMPVLRDLQG